MTGKMQRMRKKLYDTLPEGKSALVVGNNGRMPSCYGCYRVITDDNYIIIKQSGILREYHEKCAEKGETK